MVRSQFHYGSITTKANIYPLGFEKLVSIPLWFDYNNLFLSGTPTELYQSQFHYGSITTCVSSVKAEIWTRRLNSTMVRLQQYNFQQHAFGANRSQFHYGSITTSLLLFFIVYFVIRLNSTMVRLQLYVSS